MNGEMKPITLQVGAVLKYEYHDDSCDSLDTDTMELLLSLGNKYPRVIDYNDVIRIICDQEVYDILTSVGEDADFITWGEQIVWSDPDEDMVSLEDAVVIINTEHYIDVKSLW